ncbi:MAG: hypothetical protein IPM84_15050 [Anaerolineae bacterium]|nr:hypothetical protein [Anaerolineae bacterium]
MPQRREPDDATLAGQHDGSAAAYTHRGRNFRLVTRKTGNVPPTPTCRTSATYDDGEVTTITDAAAYGGTDADLRLTMRCTG